MKYFASILLIIVFLISCKKSDKTVAPNPPVATKITYSVDSASTQPGEFLTLTANGLLTKDTCSVQLAGKVTILTKIDSFHYAFLVPALSPGTYMLDLKNLNAGNNPNVVIRNYTPISDPDAVITATINNYNNLTDSLLKNCINNSVTSTDAAFMHQLMDQLSQNITLCSADEKLSLSYQFQNMQLDGSFAKNANLDTAYLKFKSTPTGSNDEISQTLIYKVIDFERVKLRAILSIPTLLATAIFAIKTPSAATSVAFIIALGNYIYSTNAAKKAAGEAVDIIGIPENPITEVNGQGTSANPVLVSIGKTILETLQSTFRTLRKADETDELNSDISDFIQGTYDLETEDITIKSLFENVKSKFSSFFDKIGITYTAFVSPVLATAKEKIAKVNNEFITVTNVSNPDITVTSIDDGINGLKLTFDNPSNNITVETNFNFQLTYTKAAINNKVPITEQAKFIPPSLPKLTTTIAGSITQTSASSGGIITGDGGSAIISKGICYSIAPNPIPDISNTVPGGTGTGSFISTITGLQPGKTYHVRAFASNSSGIGYGNDVSFTTLQPGPIVLISPAIGTVFHIPAGSTDGGVTVTFTWSGPGNELELWIEGPSPRFYNLVNNQFSIRLGSDPAFYWRVSSDNGLTWSETYQFGIVY